MNNSKQNNLKISSIKIHVLTRPNTDSALIIILKSKKATGFFELNFSNNTVTEGQWIQGKIYPRRCDLSEDGKHIIYFAAKFHIRNGPTTWTAVSKFPYFTALDFYDKGDTYNGGGLFLSKTEYLLNETYEQKELYKNSSFIVKRGKLNNVLLDDETEGLYFPKLIRDGWKDKGVTNGVRFFKKTYKNYEVSKECHIQSRLGNRENRSFFYDINEFKINGKVKMRIESDWMDFKKDKLYWANKGKIMYAHLNNIENIKEVDDLNNYDYKPIFVNYD